MDFPRAEEVRLWRYELSLDGPVSLRPGEELSAREGLIVEAISCGESHLGEAAPLPGFSRESLSDAEGQLRHIVAAAPGLNLSSEAIFRGEFHPSVDFALWSVRASMQGEAIPEVPLCALLSGDQDEMISAAVKLSRIGYRTLKIKVGRSSVAEDAGAVLRIASATGDGVRLRLDANRGWSMADAIRFASLTESVRRRIEFVEEPLSNANPDSLRTLSEEAGMPVALDETLAAAEPEILDGGRYAFAVAVVLKPQVLGATRSLAFARRAAILGARVVVSASYESGVGMLGLLRFADECGAGKIPAAGLDTYRRLREDMIEPRLNLTGPSFDGAGSASPRLRYETLERLL